MQGRGMKHGFGKTLMLTTTDNVTRRRPMLGAAPHGNRRSSAPHARPIKPVYIRKFVRLVKFGTGDEA